MFAQVDDISHLTELFRSPYILPKHSSKQVTMSEAPFVHKPKATESSPSRPSKLLAIKVN